MIYLDNSATTNIKPKDVIKDTLNAIQKLSANPGRSGHKLSIKTAEKIFDVRCNIANYLNCDKVENIIFTQNCTDALNMAVLGTVQKGGHIICSVNDHNSLIRPIFELERAGLVEVTVVSPQKNSMLTANDIEPHIKPNTYLVAINHVSNVNGDMADINSIGELCAKRCILFLLDCAQSLGHIKIDMKKNNIDMLAIAPHKALYALQGVGVLALSIKASPKPIRYGGTGTASESPYQPLEYPESLESGTIATPNIISLGSGLNFVKNNFDTINKKIDDLATYVLFELNKINNVICYTAPENVHLGVIGFNVEGLDSGLVATKLSDDFDICVRGGLHCAGLKHKSLGTLSQGIVRASLSYYNTFSDCENFIRAIKKIALIK